MTVNRRLDRSGRRAGLCDVEVVTRAVVCESVWVWWVAAAAHTAARPAGSPDVQAVVGRIQVDFRCHQGVL